MRINFLGGPCCGKSTSAAWLFSELKRLNFSVELVNEYVKAWSYQKKQIDEFDQVYLFGKQMHYEYRFLSAGVKNIITDSPTLLSSIYARVYYKNLDIHSPIKKINDEYDSKYPSFYIFLERGQKIYHQEGRYQNRDQAIEIDNIIRDEIKNFRSDKIAYINYNDKDNILKTVLKVIDI